MENMNHEKNREQIELRQKELSDITGKILRSPAWPFIVGFLLAGVGIVGAITNMVNEGIRSEDWMLWLMGLVGGLVFYRKVAERKNQLKYIDRLEREIKELSEKS